MNDNIKDVPAAAPAPDWDGDEGKRQLCEFLAGQTGETIQAVCAKIDGLDERSQGKLGGATMIAEFAMTDGLPQEHVQWCREQVVIAYRALTSAQPVDPSAAATPDRQECPQCGAEFMGTEEMLCEKCTEGMRLRDTGEYLGLIRVTAQFADVLFRVGPQHYVFRENRNGYDECPFPATDEQAAKFQADARFEPPDKKEVNP
jgi:hypothetical protein